MDKPRNEGSRYAGEIVTVSPFPYHFSFNDLSDAAFIL
jgi:hypothetical protein